MDTEGHGVGGTGDWGLGIGGRDLRAVEGRTARLARFVSREGRAAPCLAASLPRFISFLISGLPGLGGVPMMLA